MLLWLTGEIVTLSLPHRVHSPFCSLWLPATDGWITGIQTRDLPAFLLHHSGAISLLLVEFLKCYHHQCAICITFLLGFILKIFCMETSNKLMFVRFWWTLQHLDKNSLQLRRLLGNTICLCINAWLTCQRGDKDVAACRLTVAAWRYCLILLHCLLTGKYAIICLNSS